MGGANLNLVEGSGTSKHADCLLRLTHLRRLRRRTCKSASRRVIGQASVPLTFPACSAALRTVQCAHVSAGENLELGPSCGLRVCGATASTMHGHFTPQTLFSLLTPASTRPSLSWLVCDLMAPFFNFCVGCVHYGNTVHDTFDCSISLYSSMRGCQRVLALSPFFPPTTEV